jgi:hypothetical protein
VNSNEIIWAQNQEFKLYADGTLYAVSDRHEEHPISPSTDASSPSETARQMLGNAIRSMPATGQKLGAAMSNKATKKHGKD